MVLRSLLRHMSPTTYGGDVHLKVPFKSNSLRINSGQFDLQDSSFVDQTLELLGFFEFLFFDLILIVSASICAAIFAICTCLFGRSIKFRKFAPIICKQR